MAKINKTLLKNLIKECIVEVLAEGLSNSTTELNESIKTSNLKRNTNTKKIKNENFEKNIQNTTQGMTSDPLMADIFADTAKTTLQEQVAAASQKGKFVASGGDHASRTVANSDLDDLFGNSSSNWANLAFSNKER